MSNGWIKVDGVPGSAADSKHKGWSEAEWDDFHTGLPFGAMLVFPSYTGAGRLDLRINGSRGTLALARMVATGERVPTAILEASRGRGATRINLHGVTVLSVVVDSNAILLNTNLVIQYEKLDYISVNLVSP